MGHDGKTQDIRRTNIIDIAIKVLEVSIDLQVVIVGFLLSVLHIVLLRRCHHIISFG